MASISIVTVLVFSFLAVCYCVPAEYGYGGNSGSSSFGGYGREEEHNEAKPYAFGYAVKDFKKGTNFNQHESSDGHNVKGQYSVALPDGRMQIVSYNADWKNGYFADVKYVGEAHHPEVYAIQHESGGSDYGYGAGAGAGAGHGASANSFQNLGSGSHGSYGAGSGSY